MDKINKLEKLNDTVNELKVHVAKQDINFERLNDILSRLTDSVEIHVKRSDTMEELLRLYKVEMAEELTPIKNHLAFVKGASWMLSGVVAVVVVLHELGLLKF
jgi:signal recognition particle GTPase